MVKRRLLAGFGICLLGTAPALRAQTGDKATLPPEPLRDTSHKVSLLYEEKDKRAVTAALSAVRGTELTRTASATWGAWIAGRAAGVHAVQSGGEPGADDVSVFLRGQAPLVLVDGTPQSFPSINPEQVESITFLKDAVSTAMLGMRGAGGAVLITTKKGERVPGQQIRATAQHGVQQPTRMPRFLRAYDHARLYNEALVNDGQAPVYSAADLEAYRNGSDPLGHPDVDWQSEILRPQAAFSRYDLAISGGNQKSRYFVNLDYLHQEGLFRKEGFNTYNTNADYKRYLVRSNLETDLSNSITASLNLIGRIQNSNAPGAGTASILSDLRNTPALAYPVRNSDGSLGGNLEYQNNLYGQTVLSGYQQAYERDFKVDLSLKARLDKVVPGLWIRGLAAVNAYQRESLNRSKTFAVYREGADAAGTKVYTRFGTAGDQQNTIAVNSQNRLFYSEFSAGYDRKLSSRDNLSVLALASNDYRMINTDLPFSYSTLAAKVSYDHRNTYFLDLTAGYNGTERFPKNKRYGFFPAIGLGWDLSKESFLKKAASSWLDMLKLRTSYGTVGNANVGYYDYYQYYSTGSGYGFGATVPTSNTTLQQGPLANPFITWEKANKFSAGIDAELLKRRLSVTVDYFNDTYFDLVQSRNDGSDIFGTGYVQENIGKNRYSGWELSLSWQGERRDLRWIIAPNVSIVRSEVLAMTEPARPYDYQRQTGQPVGAAYGYVAEGLFGSQAEIDAHAFQGAGIRPGDIRYKDLNNDGLINGLDQTVIGNTKPFVFYGMSGAVSFKGIELHLQLQGVANSTLQTTGYRAFTNNGRGAAYASALDRWTPENPDGTYPRLWVGTNANNQLTSSYWMRKADFLRVKSLELGYQLPGAVIRKARLTGVRLFVNATNPFTFSGLNDAGIDPEAGAGIYPVMRTVTGGINLTF